MAYSESRIKEGMPFGGIPYDNILYKLEETRNDTSNIEDEYDNYARSTIIDWGPDPIFHESDQTRRDPSLSVSTLNLRYNGTRGSEPDLPRHPEIFYGFMGDDPRGSENNPRMDLMAQQLTSRAPNLIVRMGDNDDNHIAERPWTNQDISRDMKNIHRRYRNEARIFDIEKINRPWSNNISTEEETPSKIRAQTLKHGGESLNDSSYHNVMMNGNKKNGKSIWRNILLDGDLGVHSYSSNRAAPVSKIGNAAQSKHQQDLAESSITTSINNQTLAASMALAAKGRQIINSAQYDQDHSTSQINKNPSLMLNSDDVGKIYRDIIDDQSKTPQLEGRRGLSSGLEPGTNPENAIRKQEAFTSAANTHLTEVGHIVRGLKEGTSSSMRKIADNIVQDGQRAILSEGEYNPGKSLMESRDLGGVKKNINAEVVETSAGNGRYQTVKGGLIQSKDNNKVSKMTFISSNVGGGADGLEVHSYAKVPILKPAPAQLITISNHDEKTWRKQIEHQRMGISKEHEWRSNTQSQTKLDGDFGNNYEVHAITNANMGPKSLRAGTWSNGVELSDEVHEFGE
jgi:hypothetical protein